jgi:hypothetical protein
MPIRLYLAGRTFDPETTQAMSIAFQGVWDAVEDLSRGSWEAARRGRGKSVRADSASRHSRPPIRG